MLFIVFMLKQVERGRNNRTFFAWKKESLKPFWIHWTFARRKSAWCPRSKADAIGALTVRLFLRALANLIRQQRAFYANPKSNHFGVHHNGCQWPFFCLRVPTKANDRSKTHLNRLYWTFLRLDSSEGDSRTHHGLGLFQLWKAVALKCTKAMFLRRVVTAWITLD